MNGSELEENLLAIGWSIRQTAEKVGCQEQHIRRMISGQRPIDPRLERYIEVLATVHQSIPVPDLSRAPEEIEAE